MVKVWLVIVSGLDLPNWREDGRSVMNFLDKDGLKLFALRFQKLDIFSDKIEIDYELLSKCCYVEIPLDENNSMRITIKRGHYDTIKVRRPLSESKLVELRNTPCLTYGYHLIRDVDCYHVAFPFFREPEEGASLVFSVEDRTICTTNIRYLKTKYL